MKRTAAREHVRGLDILASSRRLPCPPISMRRPFEDHNRITVTPHALDKVIGILGATDREAAEIFVKMTLRQAHFIGYIANLRTRADGSVFAKIDRLFSFEGVQLVLDRTDSVVITAYVRREVAAEVQQLVDSRGDSLAVLNSMIGLLAAEEGELLDNVVTAEMAYDVNEALERVSAAGELYRRKLLQDIEDSCAALLRFLIEKKSRYLKGIAFFI